MAKKKKKVKEQMGELVGVAVSVDPIVTKRKKKKSGGAMTDKNTWEKTSIEKRKKYNEGDEVIKDLSTTAANEMLAPLYAEALQLDQKLKNPLGLANIDQTKSRLTEVEKLIADIMARTKKADGGLLGDLDKDGELSGYEEKRQDAISKAIREKKGLGGLLSRLVKTKSRPKTQTPVTTDDIGKIEKFLMDKKHPEAVSFSKQELDQIKKESGGKEEYLDFLSEFNAVKEGDIAYIIKAKKEGRSSKDIKDFLENVERNPKAEGGEMDSQMTALMMPEEETEEMDMLPDDQMEDEHLDFIINESLDQEEEMYLMDKLQADDRLSMIFDKIMDTASEFSGSGPVEGLGTGISDSIPARLSDGEFVMTAKATDEIGADNLQRMMKDAEEASDNRQRVAMGGELEKKVDEFGKPLDQDLADEEIKRSMLSVNPRLQ